MTGKDDELAVSASLSQPGAPAPPAAPPSDAPRPAAPPEKDPEPAPGGPALGRLGHYRLDRVVGRGGMGVVYDAWDEALKRRVAVKVLAPSSSGKTALERFKQEATLAARLRHPNVVVVHEAGTVGGQAFIAMEFVQGKTLEAEIDDRTGGQDLEGPARDAARREAAARLDDASLRRICALVRDVARALHYGHTYAAPGTSQVTPIIHRDVKPANIIVDERGVPRLLDYGLAKEVGLTLTLTREAVGTPLYMSPEQLFSSRRAGPRSDVYSLGMTLYSCVTLARPFELSQPEKLFEHLMHEDPPRPRTLNPSLPRDLDTIVRKATEKDERLRYATAEAFAEDLAAFLEDRPIRARAPGVFRTVARWGRRRAGPLAFASAMLVMVGVTVAVGGGVARSRDEEKNAEVQRQAEEARGRFDQADGLLIKAGMIYDLAGRARAEDPDGDRWLTLLGEGHRIESDAKSLLDRAADVLGGQATPPRVRRHLLLAQLARNDRSALAPLERLHAEALDATRRLREEESLFAWFRDRAAADAPGTLRDLRSARSRSQAGYDERYDVLLHAIGGELAGEGENDPLRDGGDWRDIIDVSLWKRVEATRSLADEEPRLASGLLALRSVARVAVDPPAQAPPSPRCRVAILEPRPGSAPVRVREGGLGEVLEVPPGDLIAAVSEDGREVRFPIHTARPGWGLASELVRTRLSLLPRAVPSDMVLVAGDGARPFLLDREEVSCASYARFLADVASTGHAGCPPEERAAFPGGKDHRPGGSLAGARAPVTGIDWWDARAYAAWSKKRLPTRAEWQTATLGGLTGARPNFRGIDDGWLWASPVDAGPEAVCGARNLLGNVAEWVACDDDAFPFREAVGGGWADAPDEPAALVARYAPLARGADLGFRCARDLPEEPRARPGELPETLLGHRDGVSMRLVRGGTFQLWGRSSSTPRWTVPSHEVVLRSFYVDPAPVSCARYAAFLDDQGRSRSPELARALAKDREAPVTGLGWHDAAAYAAWAGERLPTDAEWEAARSRLPDANRLPEWCADTWHPDFLSYVNKENPVNRWAPELGHVVRRADQREGSTTAPAGVVFRCVLDAAEEGP